MNNKNKGFTWGHGIIVTFLLFGLFMAYFYVNMSKQEIDLVGDHYYEDGQKFQEKIEIRKKTQLLKNSAEISFDSSYQLAKIQIPIGTSRMKVDFYKPSMQKEDQHFISKELKDSIWIVETSFLSKGPWKVTLSWINKGGSYQSESRILIP
jgi:nitrogen fixation protein FixH